MVSPHYKGISMYALSEEFDYDDENREFYNRIHYDDMLEDLLEDLKISIEYEDDTCDCSDCIMNNFITRLNK